MVLEATLLVLDNSEWMRNGDYTPSRLEAQSDAVNLIFGAKTQSNPENTVGLMTMAGKGPEVLVTLTSDIGKILTAMHSIKISGKGSLTNGIQVAQLALKHRQNKNHAQRVIVFVGSPVEAEEKELVRLAKKLKKNNVSVDIINFGEEAENTGKLEAFIEAVKSGENSHLVTVPPGPHILSDILISTPIIAGEVGAQGFVSNGAGGYEFGIDPSLDPELALALRISLEEERARQESESKAGQKEEGGPTAMVIDQGGPSSSVGEDDDMLAQALAMSMGNNGQNQDVHMGDLSEEEEIARAIQMSVGAEGQGSAKGTDADMLASVLGSLPGVDQNDPRIQSALKGDKGKEKKEKK